MVLASCIAGIVEAFLLVLLSEVSTDALSGKQENEYTTYNEANGNHSSAKKARKLHQSSRAVPVNMKRKANVHSKSEIHQTGQQDIKSRSEKGVNGDLTEMIRQLQATLKPPFVNMVHCPVCGKEIRSEPVLRKHMMEHTGNYPFRCDVCQKGFPESRMLSRHMKTHLKDETEHAQFFGKTEPL